jgi:hypothetical protein
MRKLLWIAMTLPLLACEKAGTGSAEAGKADAVPEPVRATLAIPSVSGLAKGLADASPLAGSFVDQNAIAHGLAEMAEANGLDGADLAQPVWALLLDPKRFAKPVVLVVAVADAARLKASAGGAAVVVKGRRALVGAQPAIDAVSAWAFGTLARVAPKRATLTIDVKRLAQAYEAEMRAGISEAAAALPGLAAVLKAEVDAALELARQTEQLEIALDVGAPGATIDLTLKPVARSGFATFVAAQKGSSFALLGRLPPATGGPSFAGHIEMANLRGPALDLVGRMLGLPFGAEERRRWNAALDLLDGEMAAASEGGPLSPFSMLEVVGVRDGPAFATAGWEAWGKPFQEARKLSVFGLDFTLHAAANVATHQGVRIDRFTMSFDVEKLPSAAVDALRSSFPDGRMEILSASFDKVCLVASGPEAEAKLRAGIDGFRRGTTTPLPAAARDAAAAGESVFWSFGGADVRLSFRDGKLRLRVNLPASVLGGK